MSAATVYKSTDANAPVLSGTEGSLIALLDAVLVDGYGDKAPLGWTKVFSGTGKAVYQPQAYGGGQAILYRVDDTASRGGYAPKVARVDGYESMSDVDTGTGHVGPVCCHKSYYANSTSRIWMVIGDAYGAYIFTSVTDANYNISVVPQYLGFLNPVRSGGVPVCGLFGEIDGLGGRNQIFYLRSGSVASSAYCFLHKSLSGALNIPCAVYAGTGAGLENAISGSATSTLPAYATGGEMVYSAPVINDGAAYTVHSHFPGIYAPQHPAAGDFPFSETGDTVAVEIDGRTLQSKWVWGVASGSANTGAVLIDLGEGFRP